MRLVIWGAGGHAKVVADLARACGYRLVGHVDRDPERVGTIAEPGGAIVVYDEQTFRKLLVEQDEDEFDAIAIAVGANGPRLAAVQALNNTSLLPPLVHPTAILSPSCKLGAGTVVMPKVVVNASTSVGQACILNTGCIVEHDCCLGDGVHVSPNATLAGGVSVGTLSWIGAGATVIQQVTIGDSVIVGAGAVVIENIPNGTTVVGCPARPIRTASV